MNDRSADDTHIYDLYIASRGSAALVVAVRLGLFSALAERVLDIPGIAQALQVSERGARALCSALRGLGLLKLDAKGYSLAPDSRRFLIPGQPDYLGALIESDYELWTSPAALLESVKQGRPQIYGGDDVWAEHGRSPERAARFAAMMTALATRPAQALAQLPPLAGRCRLLDVGAGAGIFTIEALRAHPQLRATVFDLAAVIPLARRAFDDAALTERTTFIAGDMFRDAWPGGNDTVLLSQILHDWTIEQGILLLSRAHAALEPGGIVLVHEKLISDDGKPAATALIDLDMLMWTEGQQLTQLGLRQMLEEAGFTSVETISTVGYWSVTAAHKR